MNSFSWSYNQYQRTIGVFEQQIAVRSTFKNLSKPLFQDYTWQGRIIGFLLRILRIILGLLLYFLTAICFCLGLLIWLTWPLVCLLAILGFFFGGSVQNQTNTETPSPNPYHVTF